MGFFSGSKKEYSEELIQAVYNEDISLIKKLLDKGADVNTTDPKDRDATLLITAATRRSIRIVVLLLERGANVDAQANSGYTALIVACLLGHYDTAYILVQNNADINIKENRGLTALDFAKDRGYQEIVQLLKGGGGKESGKTPPCCATCNVVSLSPDGKFLCTLNPMAVREVYRSHLCSVYEQRS